MRTYLPGDDPRVECMKQLAIESGHELTDSPASAEMVLSCQSMPENGPVFRHDTLKLLQRMGSDITGPITICLVSFEPNQAWPAGLCHCCDTTLRANTPHRWHMTRAHVRSHMPNRASDLVLGADCQESIDILRAFWEPISGLPPPLLVESVFRAERAAESVTAS